MQFYEISATVLPLFLLTIFTQRRLLMLITEIRFESEQDYLLHGALLVPAEAERLRQFLVSDDAGASGSRDLATSVTRIVARGPDTARAEMRRSRRYRLVAAVVLAVVVLLPGVAIFTCLGVMFAGGASTWVGVVLVWPGLVTSGGLLFLALFLALAVRVNIGVEAARLRLHDKGIVSATAALPGDRREFEEQAEYVRRTERELGMGEGGGFL